MFSVAGVLHRGLISASKTSNWKDFLFEALHIEFEPTANWSLSTKFVVEVGYVVHHLHLHLPASSIHIRSLVWQRSEGVAALRRLLNETLCA